MLHCISILPKLECLVRTPDLKRQFRLISPSNRKLSPNLLYWCTIETSLLYFSYDAFTLNSLKQNKYSVRRRYFCTFEHIESKHPRSNPYYNLGILYIYLSRYLLYLLLYIYLGTCYTYSPPGENPPGKWTSYKIYLQEKEKIIKDFSKFGILV